MVISAVTGIVGAVGGAASDPLRWGNGEARPAADAVAASPGGAAGTFGDLRGALQELTRMTPKWADEADARVGSVFVSKRRIQLASDWRTWALRSVSGRSRAHRRRRSPSKETEHPPALATRRRDGRRTGRPRCAGSVDHGVEQQHKAP